MATVTETTANFVDNFKTLFAPERAEEIIYNKTARPALSLFKAVKVDAETNKYAVIYDDGAGGSATFSNAQSNGAAPSTQGFTLTLNELYRVLTVSNKALLSMKSAKGAFLSEQALRGKMMLEGLANDLEKALFGSYLGLRGEIATSGVTPGSSADVVLTQAGDIRKWHVGDVVNYYDASAGHLHYSSGTTPIVNTVKSINRSTKTITMTANVPSGGGTITAGDSLVREGDYDNGLYGIGDYLPETVTATAFAGVDRTVDPERLAGSRVNVDAGNLYEGINELIMEIFGVTGTTADTVLMSVDNLRKLRDQNADRVVFNAGGGMSLGSSKVELLSSVSSGPIQVIPSPFCPDDAIFAVDKSTWQIIHLDSRLIGLDTLDGNSAMRAASAAAVEFRFSAYPQLRCLKPGHNGRGIVA